MSPPLLIDPPPFRTRRGRYTAPPTWVPADTERIRGPLFFPTRPHWGLPLFSFRSGLSLSFLMVGAMF